MVDIILSKLHYAIIGFGLWTHYELFNELNLNLIQSSNNITKSEKRLAKKKIEQKDLSRYLKDVDKEKKKMDRVFKEFENIQRKLPENISDTDNMGILKELSEKTNIQDIFIEPKDETNHGSYFSKQYQLKSQWYIFTISYFI